MASVTSLREHLVEELNDLLNAEQQLIEALPQMAEHASSRELRAAFKSHLAETRRHEKRVSQALKQLGEEASGKTCEAMQGLLEEGQSLMGSTEPGALQDAMLITAAQKVEHYEIATYGTVRTYASVVGARGVAKLLQETLREEKAADKKLTAIAEGSVNRRASQEYHEQTASATDMLQKGAEWVGSAVGGAFKSVMPRSTQAADRTRASSSRSSSRSSRGSRKTSGRKTARRSRKSTR
jgi:ferritin-like metal-binding protein YciE